MKLKQAIAEQVDIDVSDPNEKVSVINILLINGVEFDNHLLSDGNYISLYATNEWSFASKASNIFELIPASDFIRDNLPQRELNDPMHPNDPQPHSMNIL